MFLRLCRASSNRKMDFQPAKKTTGRLLFFWVNTCPLDTIGWLTKKIQIRYYGIFLLFFDVVQIHVFAIPGITSDTLWDILVTPALTIYGTDDINIYLQLRGHGFYYSHRGCAQPVADRSHHANANIRSLQMLRQGKFRIFSWASVLTCDYR